MPQLNLDINLGLPATPQIDDQKYFGEFRRIYSAINALANYLSTLNAAVLGLTTNRGAATLVAGSVVVANTSIAAGSLVFLSVQVLGTVATPKAIAVTARTPGVSFTITSADATDTSSVAWWF